MIHQRRPQKRPGDRIHRFLRGSSGGTGDASHSIVSSKSNRGGSMNDAMTSAGANPYPLVRPPHPPVPPPARRWSYWARKFLVCNPFYLASAALLLFGLLLIFATASGVAPFIYTLF